MISPQQVSDIAGLVEVEGLGEETVRWLRVRYPGLHFTYCMDDDIQGMDEPFHSHPRFNIYLIDGRQHCLRLTDQLENATGLVLAAVLEEAA